MMRGSLNGATSTLVGLLSSSCCLIQLILNGLSLLQVVHVGCAGFQTWLGGTTRLYIRSVSMVWLVTLWARALFTHPKKHIQPQAKGTSCCTNDFEFDGSTEVHLLSRRNKSKLRLLCWSVWTLFLMWLPEGLQFLDSRNTSNVFPIRALLLDSAIIPSSTGGSISQEKERHVEYVSFVVDNMGCEACESMVKRILLESQHHEQEDDAIRLDMQQVTVHWETGLAELQISSSSSFTSLDKENLQSELDARLRHHGYALYPLGHITKKMQLMDNTIIPTPKDNPFQ
uniref:HMA domain-containing protein n=1 Tax=Attheya septentrionalis TaxID=420275 RepID=A0A7S2UK21_9STRA|mmetsp:Transcript_26852/g.48799  ORF Transcript_26852/g.48799 Transcript_26852/m.48799 type:complete len:285 (+) Transcript_26852:226-1080(+)|eukprot:CAMPEP_0198286712 /NCGR_PEP_ID=MMETSP1449-20131203/5707_1 /TAXON_ID=420275 /ORGANISM="Attheya septentrionalis, Strain CCMP2084" /LENGTH=284 /DNA_ID=CAMNT_0043984497 /DNA_START=191 /DNA_END=1045 /DNA_ORIENTATION=+